MTLTGSDGTVVELDAVVEETPTRNFDATEHPVEVGANIVDHVRPKSRELKINALVVDTPYGEESQPGRSRDAHAALARAGAQGVTFTITDGLERYENMILTTISTTLTKQIGTDALKLQLGFREIRLVSTQTVAFQVRKAVSKAKPKENDGAKSGPPVKRSGLKQVFDPKQPKDLGNRIKRGLGGVASRAP
jgi:hypothetical protein